MKIKQISIFLENKRGRLYEALNALAEEEINIRALSIADTSEFGILRIIVTDPEKAKEILEKNEFTVKLTNVVAMAVNDKPGGLAEALKYLYDANINIEYIYAFVEKSGQKAVVVLRTENLDKTIVVLQENGITLLTWENVLAL
ncbi:MAG TPA: ACT domain-containing protein [Thermodesulfovibrio thiophilus]|uniref:ACT domain-containing protein n=1 Tax=Thermodesulfovibrio thiophilus TaxID=340095 RepID=UPI000428E5CE|nr:ACT domain-containing protein [Thermodesulfovibrio thiophilus]HHW20030.1 ACT domain-containing protein [Thermodesulfovibrio thiophilus]HOA83308.1 ACT domain-containing protein [Thermodesulfovibrio thiophilus]HQA03690.1 ACT domain-containing protein [Thermodesulfovibrio thiophilus]HQD36489.1 ACT domain-containing protein [Thermodesulfovibrio thiophilus]